MAGAGFTYAGDQNSLPYYLLWIWTIQKKTRLTKKNLVDTVKQDLRDIKLTWQEAEELKADESKRCW